MLFFFLIQNKMRQIILGNGKAYGNVSTAQGCPPLILLWIVNNVPLCGTVLFLFEAGTPLLLSTPLCSFNIWVPSGICPSSPSSSLPANWTSLCIPQWSHPAQFRSFPCFPLFEYVFSQPGFVGLCILDHSAPVEFSTDSQLPVVSIYTPEILCQQKPWLWRLQMNLPGSMGHILLCLWSCCHCKIGSYPSQKWRLKKGTVKPLCWAILFPLRAFVGLFCFF